MEYYSEDYAEKLKNLIESNSMTIGEVMSSGLAITVVYAISEPDTKDIVYVGETTNFRSRMWDHGIENRSFAEKTKKSCEERKQ